MVNSGFMAAITSEIGADIDGSKTSVELVTDGAVASAAAAKLKEKQESQ